MTLSSGLTERSWRGGTGTGTKVTVSQRGLHNRASENPTRPYPTVEIPSFTSLISRTPSCDTRPPTGSNTFTGGTDADFNVHPTLLRDRRRVNDWGR